MSDAPKIPTALHRLDNLLARLLGGLLPEERRYWILVPLAGACAGLLAVALVKLLAGVQALFWGDGQSLLRGAERTRAAAWWLVVLIPVSGGALAAVATRLLGKEKGFTGNSALIEALAFKKGQLPLARSLWGAVVSIAAVGSGASLGREGALITSGSSLASWVGGKLRLKEHHVKVLLACGAAGGMAAAYNVPLGASIFAMEVLLGSFALDLFGPIIISSVIATAVSRTLLTSYPAYVVPEYALPGSGMLGHLATGVAIGIAIGLVSALFIFLFSRLGELFRWLEGLDLLKPTLVMGALGGVAVFFPELLGNGYDTVNRVLHDEFPVQPLHVVSICALKILFSALCRASGIPGGLFTPSLFVGALLGAACADLLAPLVPRDPSTVPVCALLGMGAILAGTIHAPITAVLLVFELTQNYAVVLPLMCASLASTLVSRLLSRGSLITEPLRRRGISLPGALTPTWLRQPTVRDFVNPIVDTVPAAERFERVVEAFLRAPVDHDRLYVLDGQGAYIGAVSLGEIKRFIRESANLDWVIAADILDSSFPSVCLDEPLARAVEILSETDAERLPVLENPTSRRLVGSVSKRRLLAVYREMNLARGPVELGR